MKSLFTVLACLPFLLSASNIHFASGDWKDLLASAKSHNKLVFVDGYTTWCKSCRWMDRNTFQDSAVADYYNQHFINVKLDMEKGVGQQLAQTHQIAEYPAFLFLDGNGELVNKAYGAKHADRFLKLGKATEETKPIPDSSQAEPRRPIPLRDLNSDRKVRVVYFVPSDRSPTEYYREKIHTLMTFVNDLYIQSFERAGISSNGLDFEFKFNELDVRYVRGDHPAKHYNQAPAYDTNNQWNTIADELSQKIGSPQKNLYIVFAETYDEHPHTEPEFEFAGGIALGGRNSPDGGLGIFSSWILRDEFCATTVGEQLKLLADQTPIYGRKAIGSGLLDSPRSEFIEDGFGAVAHELGHALGLPHDFREDNQYIMGNGFRNLANNYFYPDRPAALFSIENTHTLACSRFLSPHIQDTKDNQPAEINLILSREVEVEDEEIHFRAIARDNKGLGAMVLINSLTGSVATGKALSGLQQEFSGSFRVKNLPEGEIPLQINLWDANGNLTVEKIRITVPFTPDPDSKLGFPEALEIYSFAEGSFRNMGGNRWKEYNKDGGAVFFFDEQYRNSSYVYLNDPSRGIGIQIPIEGGEAKIAGEDNEWRPFHKMWLSGGASAGELIYEHSKGRFETRNGLDWLERDAMGYVIFKFRWLRDNETYIYIEDASRGLILKFPKVGGKMYLSGDEGKNWSMLYEVEKVKE